jgi:hypothetical protein
LVCGRFTVVCKLGLQAGLQTAARPDAGPSRCTPILDRPARGLSHLAADHGD